MPAKVTKGEEKEAGGEFVERVSLVSHIHRQLSYSIFGLSFLAVPIGLITAYGAWGFREAFGLMGDWFLSADYFSREITTMIELTIGGLVFGLALHFLKWDRFRNPAHVIVAVSENEGRLSARDGIVTGLADALSLALNAPVGRYGPAVYLGATIGSLVAQLFRMSETSIRILLGCGVAAAISASFNAPIAGVIFAHEVIIGHFKLKAFAPITLASVAAVAVSQFHHVEYVALKLWSAPHDISPGDYPIYLGFGLVAAFVAIVYMTGIMQASLVAKKCRLPKWFQPVLGGLLAGAVGLFVPKVLGLGDEILQAILEQDVDRPSYGIRMLLILAGGKLIASVLALGLRYPGGAFTPAIFIGATLGGVAGMVIPGLDYQISVLVGMGAMVGSVVGAPLAVILIVFEMTENYEAATAVMVAVVAANAVVTRYFARSLFHRQIRFWGIEINRPAEQRIMALQKVTEITRRHFVAIPSEGTVAEALERFDQRRDRNVFLIDARGALVSQLEAVDWEEVDPASPIADYSELCPTILEQNDSLWAGFRKMENGPTSVAPVVDSEESRRLVGVATTSDFLAVYRQAVKESRVEK